MQLNKKVLDAIERMVVHKAKVGLQVHKAKVGLQVHKAKVGLQVHKAKVGLQVHKAKVGLQVHKAKVGLQVHKAKAELQVHEAKAGLQVHKAKVAEDGGCQHEGHEFKYLLVLEDIASSTTNLWPLRTTGLDEIGDILVKAYGSPKTVPISKAEAAALQYYLDRDKQRPGGTDWGHEVFRTLSAQEHNNVPFGLKDSSVESKRQTLNFQRKARSYSNVEGKLHKNGKLVMIQEDFKDIMRVYHDAASHPGITVVKRKLTESDTDSSDLEVAPAAFSTDLLKTVGCASLRGLHRGPSGQVDKWVIEEVDIPLQYEMIEADLVTNQLSLKLWNCVLEPMLEDLRPDYLGNKNDTGLHSIPDGVREVQRTVNTSS
uniref:Uncharacterized protein n=1 Tax=Branchiostoma floridae TaxID=7739 RepID=C3Z171_BRAFL|eukprot:XP_002597758.1 hypothetical protein BRAFLDRAFT_77339 [Branchiostoma floridae]